MDHGGKAVVGFIGSHGDALKLREFAEEVLDQMTPFVEFGIEWDGCGTPRMLADCVRRVPAQRSGIASRHVMLGNPILLPSPTGPRPGGLGPMAGL